MSQADENRVAVRAVLTAALLSAIGQAGFLAFKVRLVGVTRLSYEQGAHALVCVALFAFLWALRARATPRWCQVAFLVIGAPFYVTAWTGELQRVAHGLTFAPLIGEKLVVLGIAMLAPQAVGVVLIVGFGVEALVLWRLGAFAVDSGAPWIMLVYCVVGLGLLFHRVRKLSVERELARVRADALAKERLARALLAVRDLANTPLQTIEINLELIQRGSGKDARSRARIDNALGRLRELDAMLRKLTADANLGASFDSRAILTP